MERDLKDDIRGLLIKAYSERSLGTLEDMELTLIRMGQIPATHDRISTLERIEAEKDRKAYKSLEDYAKEFNLASKAGLIEMKPDSKYTVRGVPSEVMGVPDKEFGERYSV